MNSNLIPSHLHSHWRRSFRPLTAVRSPLLALALGVGLTGCIAPDSSPEDTGVASAKLIIPAPDPTVNENFGDAIVADAQTLIVGDHQAKALDNSGSIAPKGQVSVYNKTGATWTQIQTLLPDPPGKSSEIHFGERLAMNGNLLVVSAGRDALGTGSLDAQQGAVYVFTRPGPGQQFTKVAKLAAQNNPTQDTRFGGIIATNGNFIAAAPDLSSFQAHNYVQIYSVQGNTVTFLYTITTDPSTPILDIAITSAGVLIINNGAQSLGYDLTPTQAVAIANAQALLTSSIPQLVASGGSVAALDVNAGGKVIVGTVDTARVNATTTINIGAANSSLLHKMTFLEGQHVLVSQNDPNRPSLLKYEPSGGTFALTGSIYPPLGTRVRDSFFGFSGLTSTSDFVAVTDAAAPGQVFVLGVEPNGFLNGAVYEQQRLATADTCGNQCAGQSFLEANYGKQVAISGDVAVVTTTEQLDPPNRNPAAHIYVRQTSGVWQHAQTVDLGGKESRGVAVNNGRVFIGQGTFTGATGFSNGSVRVYEQSGGVWTQTGTLVAADDGSFSSTFIGDTIAVDGDTAVAGSFGFVYVFTRNADGSWTQSKKLSLDPSITSSRGFTHSVALSADHLVVGAKWDNQLADTAGSAFIYKRSDFTLEQKLLTIFSAAAHLEFGSAVAADGNTVMIGAPGGGFVDIYTLTGTGSTPWVRSTSPFTPVNGSSYRVGTSISLSGDQVLLGALDDSLTGTLDGAAYLVKRINGNWDLANTHVLIPHSHSNGDSPFFGWSAQLSGSRAIVGAPDTTDGGFAAAGAAYIYEGLVDADNDGLLAGEDCNDTDGLGLGCPTQPANMNLEQIAPLWTADSGTFAYDTTQHTGGPTSLRIGTGATKLRGPSFSSAVFGEVGTTLALDVFQTTATSNAVTLFMSAPAFGLTESVIGTVSLSGLPLNKWTTIAVPLTTQQRNILLHQTTPVQFTISLNSGGPGLFIDRLHFSGTFQSRSVQPSAIAATLGTTSDSGGNYCVALTLSNSGSSATAGWNVVFNTNGTTLTSNPTPWGAAFTGTSGTVTITSNQVWNSSIPAGATAFNPSVGFCATRPTGNHSLPTVVSATAL